MVTLLLAIFLLAGVTLAQDDCPLGEGWVTVGGANICMKFSDDTASLDDARANCAAMSTDDCPVALLAPQHAMHVHNEITANHPSEATTLYRISGRYNEAFGAWVNPDNNLQVNLPAYMLDDDGNPHGATSPDNSNSIGLDADLGIALGSVGKDAAEAYICQSCSSDEPFMNYCPLNVDMCGWQIAGDICYKTFDVDRSYEDALTTCRALSTEDCPAMLLELNSIPSIPTTYDWPNSLAEYDLNYMVDAVYRGGVWVRGDNMTESFFPPTYANDANQPYDDDMAAVEGSHAAVNYRTGRVVVGGSNSGRFICQSCTAPIPTCDASCDECVIPGMESGEIEVETARMIRR